ncbi:hypothetical protein H2200_013611 [Cladophialophora chaetospira]|uniref:Uncharacterized protein n=1 Tax=Cladophialophora chaetospira TaxID=386627 RepID=A0AA38U9C6_9EURO|nr:hypothetical protein H2200_013611 [Cladophialophora chaetospira]
MASSYQPVQFEYLDDQLPLLSSQQTYEFENDFSFSDLGNANPATVFEPFEYMGIDPQAMTFDETLPQSQYPLQGLLPEIDVVTQLNDLSLLNNRLQQRVDELDIVCGKLQEKNVAKRREVSTVDMWLKKLVDWYFCFKTLTNRHAEKVSFEIESIKANRVVE